jgi:hypothetical protein
MRTKLELVKRIKKKEAEICALRKQLEQAEAYLQGMTDSLKLFPKDGESEGDSVSVLRAGSQLAAARDAIRAAGHALHISDLLTAIGKEPTKANKLSLSGSLGDYVRKQLVFTRPKPNTFGLKEIEDDSATALTLEELSDELESEAH